MSLLLQSRNRYSRSKLVNNSHATTLMTGQTSKNSRWLACACIKIWDSSKFMQVYASWRSNASETCNLHQLASSFDRGFNLKRKIFFLIFLKNWTACKFQICDVRVCKFGHCHFCNGCKFGHCQICLVCKPNGKLDFSSSETSQKWRIDKNSYRQIIVLYWICLIILVSSSSLVKFPPWADFPYLLLYPFVCRYDDIYLWNSSRLTRIHFPFLSNPKNPW